MNKDDIIRMAQAAGFSVGPSRDGPDDVWGVGANLERFFHMAQAAEREACAKVCDKEANDRSENDHWTGCASYLAHRIRSRGKA